jgi:hypothetical protein
MSNFLFFNSTVIQNRNHNQILHKLHIGQLLGTFDSGFRLHTPLILTKRITPGGFVPIFHSIQALALNLAKPKGPGLIYQSVKKKGEHLQLQSNSNFSS